ncbi:MAG TPA: DUF4377 domain-containing protein [Chitinophagales bacterium]|jgi:heat shock protein HslJ|nr:DUF4377 domain-containing protein [Chitinophagales bacterium]HQV77494.1 DUF4377 domain-containing protein [Chitinophagales bacterium]HQW78556.1 DUF4377 domain-containing protein [Chitinophagales bacterium]HRB66727.1 DUF4377 domain-containing protein [Chitinophagales bacterium]HRB92064.1 DUF4377 domain-containing protein [Chitinophagales bacterium]
MKFNYNIILTLLCIFTTVNSIAQTYNPNPETWIISSETTQCETSTDECLLVKQAGKKEFEIFNEKIEGFNFEKGYQYTISVKQEIKQPPIAAGESVFKYVLLKVIAQKSTYTPAETINNSNTSNNKSKFFDINYETVPCGSNYTQACLLLKEKGKSEFEIFEGSIYGFNYQAGYNYTIEVKETGNSNYYLVKEIKKTSINTPANTQEINATNNNSVSTNTINNKIIQPTSIPTTSNLDGRWYVRKIKDSDGSSFVTDDNVLWIEINTFRDKLDGFGACNKFEAVVKSDLKTTCQISKITSTFSNCGNKKLENLFFQLLQEVNRFEIKNGNLILSNQWNFLLGFTSNPNNKQDIPTTFTPPTIVSNSNLVYATNKNEENKPNTTSISNSSTTITETKVNPSSNANLDELKQKENEIEILKKQLAEQEKVKQQKELEKKNTEALALKQQQEAQEKATIEKQKLAKQKEIDDLKKLIAEKENDNNLKETASNKPNLAVTKNEEKANVDLSDNSNGNDENYVEKVKVVNDYQITKFVKNTSNTNIQDPDFPLRPYYLDGNELVKLERSEANFAAKAKGLYRGVDKQVQIMKEESPIQFAKNNIPRFFILIEDGDIDPYDVVDLCKADKIGKGRRNFTYAGVKYGGRVKDVTGKLIQLDFKKIRKGLYEIIIEQELPQGEYAFLPLFSANSISSTNSVKANCFGVVDTEN